MRTAVHTLAVLLAVLPADALRTPHPLLSSAAAHAYRAQAGREFARVAPHIKAPLLENSNKTEDLAAGKALLKKMDRATQTPAAMTPVSLQRAAAMTNAEQATEERRRSTVLAFWVPENTR